jgi:hypothetical protein
MVDESGVASSGRRAGSTGRPEGIRHDLQIVRHSHDGDLGGMVTRKSQQGRRGIADETIEAWRLPVQIWESHEFRLLFCADGESFADSEEIPRRPSLGDSDGFM